MACPLKWLLQLLVSFYLNYAYKSAFLRRRGPTLSQLEKFVKLCSFLYVVSNSVTSHAILCYSA